MRSLLALGLWTMLAAATVWASPLDEPRSPRLRPQQDRLDALLADGARRSPTLRALVARIEASDVFVYLGLDPLLGDKLSGRVTWMSQAGPYRYLRASINPDQAPDAIIAALAHELQHVTEVIDSPDVTSDHSLAELYRRIGRPSAVQAASSWETEAAQLKGRQVRRELASAGAVAALRGEAQQ